MDKYQISGGEQESLPNLLGLTNVEEINVSESEGFLDAEVRLMLELSKDTVFDISYIKNIHQYALGHLYSFAGKYRTVNTSKGGFLFPSAMFLDGSMLSFERIILKNLSADYDCIDKLVKDIAAVHAELLFIHPFREGNGRTARILANLMLHKQGYKKLNFAKMGEALKEEYIIAVQKAADTDYEAMEKIIWQLFDDEI